MVAEVHRADPKNSSAQLIEVSDMPAQKIILKKRLKAELSVRARIESIGGKNSMVLVEDSSSDEVQESTRKRKATNVNQQLNDVCGMSYKDIDYYMASESLSIVTGASTACGSLNHRDPEGLKMDLSKKKQCGRILLTLMNHQHGWVFRQPVDPVELNIPDYFSSIRKPMDLGTIKRKLQKNSYSSTQQFASDVRLTFSNAMRYNPPGNIVHIMAKDLNDVFDARWKSLEFKWRNELTISCQQSEMKMKKCQASTNQVCRRTPLRNSGSSPSKSLTAADKLKLQNCLEKYSRRNIPPRLLKFLQRTGLFAPREERINLDIDSLDESTLWELHLIVNSCGDAGSTNPAGSMTNSPGLMKCYKGSAASRIRVGCIRDRSHRPPSACMDRNHPCLGTNSSCSHQNGYAQASFSDVESERSFGREDLVSHLITSDLDGENISGMHDTSDSSDRVDGIDIEIFCGQQLSPSSALRAAKLKSRFADTILKAQHKTLLNHGEKSNPEKLQLERERLEKKQQEEKARIEAQIRAAEAAVRLKAEAEIKMRREREREAARLALQKMEKTVDIDENIHTFRELQNLGCCQPTHLGLPDEMVANFVNAVEQQSALANPLEQLGLFMKEDELDEEIDNWLSLDGDDMEEGEIGTS